MRLFIAIAPDRAMRDALISVQDALRVQGVRGSYAPPENLHLTLAFIGEFGDPDAVLAAMETLAFAPFSLRLDRLGAFDEVWWAGLEQSEALDALVRQLRHALAEAGIPFDRKSFRAHITLLRRPVFPRDRRPAAPPVPRAEMRVQRVSLMLSTRGKHGMIYTELGAVAARPEAISGSGRERTESE